MDDETAVTTSTGGRTVGLVLLWGVLLLALLAAYTYAGYYYTMPVWAIAVLVLLAAGAIVALVFAVKGARHKVWTIVAAVAALLVALAAALPLFFVMPAPVEARARQIADAADFKVVLPSGEKLEVKDAWGYDPSTNLVNGVFTAHYAHFEVQERAQASELTTAQLEGVAKEMNPGEPTRSTIVVDSKDQLTILGRPALGVAWHEQMPGKSGGSGAYVMFQPEGVVVKLTSDATDQSGLSVDELAGLAKTFEPVK